MLEVVAQVNGIYAFANEVLLDCDRTTGVERCLDDVTRNGRTAKRLQSNEAPVAGKDTVFLLFPDDRERVKKADRGDGVNQRLHLVVVGDTPNGIDGRKQVRERDLFDLHRISPSRTSLPHFQSFVKCFGAPAAYPLRIGINA